MLKIAVCDDDFATLKKTAEYIKLWASESGTALQVFAYSGAGELLEDSESFSADIFFLDIIMPDVTGMDAAKELRKRGSSAAIVFLTSAAEFALESYDVKASDYLLKPLTYEKLKKTLYELTKKEEKHQTLVLRTSFGYQTVHFSDIEYAEAQNKKAIFYLKNKTTVESHDSLGTFADKLTLENKFFKCHRSYLVYMPNVDRFNSAEIVTKTGRHIPIARGQTQAFKEAYFSLMFD